MIDIMDRDFIEWLGGLPGVERKFAAGQHVFRQGDKVGLLHLVADGAVHLLRAQASGGTSILQRAVAPSILAEASVFAVSYHCDALAICATKTRAISMPVLRARMARDIQLTNAWAAYLAREIQATRARAELLALRTVAQRLDAWLLGRSGRATRRSSWKNVAVEIGVSPEALYREIAKRRRVGESAWER